MARPDLDEILKAAERATNLTGQLLAFARKQIIALQVLQLNDLILRVGALLRRLIGVDIELVTLPSPNLWLIKADPGQADNPVAPGDQGAVHIWVYRYGDHPAPADHLRKRLFAEALRADHLSSESA